MCQSKLRDQCCDVIFYQFRVRYHYDLTHVWFDEFVEFFSRVMEKKHFLKTRQMRNKHEGLLIGKKRRWAWSFQGAPVWSSSRSAAMYFSSSSCFLRRKMASSMSFCDGTDTCGGETKEKKTCTGNRFAWNSQQIDVRGRRSAALPVQSPRRCRPSCCRRRGPQGRPWRTCWPCRRHPLPRRGRRRRPRRRPLSWLATRLRPWPALSKGKKKENHFQVNTFNLSFEISLTMGKPLMG